MEIHIIIILVCVILSAYFSATETAFSTFNRIRVKNMAEKGNDRSNAKISDNDILRILKAKGQVQVFSESYKSFTTGKSAIQDNKERLFLCICHE